MDVIDSKKGSANAAMTKVVGVVVGGTVVIYLLSFLVPEMSTAASTLNATGETGAGMALIVPGIILIVALAGILLGALKK